MPGTLLFVHGTGVRDVSHALEDIREGAARILGWGDDQVVAVEWGRAVGPPDLDIRPTLPLEDATKGIGDDVSDTEIEAALWEVLLADPTVELRVLAEGPRAVGAVMDPGGDDPPGVLFRQRVVGLAVPDEPLVTAGLEQADVKAAATALAADPTLPGAAVAVGDADDEQLVAATAHALVATMLRDRIIGTEPGLAPPTAAYDAAARDELVAAVESELAPVGTKGIGGTLLKKVMSPLITRLAVSKRAAFMGPLSDFVRDVTYYIQHGETIRNYLKEEVRRHGGDGTSGPVVVLAHSLGGVAAVDLMADSAVMEGPEPLKVDLLVTVGSQAPFLYLLESLSSMSPRKPEQQPFVPWLNIYNRQDLLSFCASRVFVNSPKIVDEGVAPGVPFPMSHSAYWTQDRVYELILTHLPR